MYRDFKFESRIDKRFLKRGSEMFSKSKIIFCKKSKRYLK